MTNSNIPHMPPLSSNIELRILHSRDFRYGFADGLKFVIGIIDQSDDELCNNGSEYREAFELASEAFWEYNEAAQIILDRMKELKLQI